MLRNNNIAILQARLKTFVDLNSPASLLKCHILLLAYLQRSGMIPSCDEARLALLMETVVDRDFVQAGGSDELFQVCDSICLFEAVREHTIELSFWVEEIIVWIDDDDCCVRRHDGLKFG